VLKAPTSAGGGLNTANPRGPGAETRWLPLRLLAAVTASSLEGYPARRWSGSLGSDMQRALGASDPGHLVELAAALAWGVREKTPWQQLHLEGLTRESLMSALAAVEALGERPSGAVDASAALETASAHQAELEAALDNLKSVFAYVRQRDRELAPLVFLFLSLVASLLESELRFVDLSLRTLRDLGASARIRAEGLEREAAGILLADDSPEAQRKREGEWAARVDGAMREAAFWKHEVEKSVRKTSLAESAQLLRQGSEAAALYSEFISRVAEARREVAV
jgi:hypothetical protein